MNWTKRLLSLFIIMCVMVTFTPVANMEEEVLPEVQEVILEEPAEVEYEEESEDPSELVELEMPVEDGEEAYDEEVVEFPQVEESEGYQYVKAAADTEVYGIDEAGDSLGMIDKDTVVLKVGEDAEFAHIAFLTEDGAITGRVAAADLAELSDDELVALFDMFALSEGVVPYEDDINYPLPMVEVSGEADEEVELTPEVFAAGTSPINITLQPEDAVAPVGETVIFKVEAEGEGLTYQWYTKRATATSFSAWSGRTGKTTSLKVGSAHEGMQVYCKVTNAAGQTKDSDIATVSVGTPINITLQPEDAVAPVGTTVIFKVEAEGEGLTYQWYTKRATATSFSAWSGRTGKTTSLKVGSAHEGMQVYCKVTNAAGQTKDSDIATVTLGSPINIVTQPEDTEILRSKKASFTVEAEGDGLTYQWYSKRATATSFSKWTGKTSKTVTFTPTAVHNGLEVYCEITNANGDTNKTDVATLTVLESVTVNDIVYTLNTDATAMIVTAYNANASSVTVQETVEGFTVKEIGESAFAGKSALVEIDLPDTIEVIGKRAFANCTKLSTMK